MIVLMSGQIASGKTVVAQELADLIGGRHVRVREALAEILQVDISDRRRLQVAGAELDQRTNGLWLRDYLANREGLGATLIIDALRTVRQTEPILAGVNQARLVYLRAHESTRRRRYANADDPLKRRISFDDAVSHPTERDVKDLAGMAAVAIETDDETPRRIAAEVAGLLGLPTREDGGTSDDLR